MDMNTVYAYSAPLENIEIIQCYFKSVWNILNII